MLFRSVSQSRYRRVRALLRTERCDDIDLSGYDLGNVRTLRDYEKYAGIYFKERSVQQYTIDNKYPPNPYIEDDELWKLSFAKSFYYLVNIERQYFPGDDYQHILVAFDDEEGKSIDSEFIADSRLEYFMKSGNPIHYEKFFLTSKTPKRVVYWAYSKNKGWSERIEISLNN